MKKKPIDPRRLPLKLIFAINTYYAFKHSRDGQACTQMFPDKRTKETCCQAVCDVASQYGFSCCIVPGTFFLNKNNRDCQINGPIMPPKWTADNVRHVGPV